jgi:hypothetical protein
VQGLEAVSSKAPVPPNNNNKKQQKLNMYVGNWVVRLDHWVFLPLFTNLTASYNK